MTYFYSNWDYISVLLDIVVFKSVNYFELNVKYYGLYNDISCNYNPLTDFFKVFGSKSYISAVYGLFKNIINIIKIIFYWISLKYILIILKYKSIVLIYLIIIDRKWEYLVASSFAWKDFIKHYSFFFYKITSSKLFIF